MAYKCDIIAKEVDGKTRFVGIEGLIKDMGKVNSKFVGWIPSKIEPNGVISAIDLLFEDMDDSINYSFSSLMAQVVCHTIVNAKYDSKINAGTLCGTIPYEINDKGQITQFILIFQD